MDGQRARPSKPLDATEFFQAYVKALLDVITASEASWNSVFAAWSEYLHEGFRSASPSRVVAPAHGEAVLGEWRCAFLQGNYSEPDFSQWKVGEYSPTCIDCTIVLERRYTASVGEAPHKRSLLHLRATATRRPDGELRVLAHFYGPAPQLCLLGVQSRSQIGQDVWVLERFKGVSNGFFLEVGANHPEELSNTVMLEEALHWRGICVEPFPVGDWSKRQAKLVQKAVGPDGGKLPFVAPGHVLGGLVEKVDMPRVQFQVPEEQRSIVEVETQTLHTILCSAWAALKSDMNGKIDSNEKMPKVIHYFSLDTEGSEYDILCQFPFKECTLLSLTVEHNCLEPARTKIRELLAEHGFVVDASVEHDDFFVLRDYKQYL